MIRLSARGWNNVLIIAVLLMLLLFNGSQWLNQGPTKPQARPFIYPHEALLTLDFGQVRLERIGQSWRLVGLQNHSWDAPALAERWQNLYLEPIADVRLQNGVVATATLAGEPQPRVITLMDLGDDVLVELQGYTYQLPNMQVRELVPGADDA